VCDTLVSLTADGVRFAKNSDRDANEAQVVEWHPAVEHAEGAMVTCTWISIPQVTLTFATVLSRPWWMWGAEMGANEHGVVIGNEAVFTDQPLEDTGLLGMDLLRLGLERGTTAEEAVGVIVELLERHGQGGSCSYEHPRFRYHNSFLVADPTGAIVLETAGRRWATEKVDGPGRAISNGLTIPGFAEAHRDRLKSRVAACNARRAITQARAESAGEVADLMATLRSHGISPSPTYSALNGAMSAPCLHAGGLATASQTTASWVADLTAPRPHHWVTATAAPCTSIFKPIDLDEPLPPAPVPTNRADDASAWWRHERLHRLTLRDHAAATARFAPARDRLEAAWLAHPPSAAEAFRVASEHEDRWFEDLVAAGLPDRRPRWLRRYWSRQDDAAGFAPAMRPRVRVA
jgi:dipeptidase